jgi:hypothetical protein
MKEYLHTGCRRGSVNLWTVGLKHEQIEICGDRRNVRVGGIGQILMVELRIIDSRLDVNFMMKYQLIQMKRILFLHFLLKLILVLELSSTPSNVIKSTTLSAEKYSNTRNSFYTECGFTSTNGNRYYHGITSRIVGGRQAIPHSHPWQVLLNNRGKFCGGYILFYLVRRKSFLFISFSKCTQCKLGSNCSTLCQWVNNSV